MKKLSNNAATVIASLIISAIVCFSALGIGSILVNADNNKLLDSSPRIVMGGGDVSEPANIPPVAVIGDLQTGFTGDYYNLPADHPDVEGNVTGVVTGDTPFNHDWWDSQYFAFTQNDLDLTFGSDFFPVDEGLEGDPQYFSVHWYAHITIPEDDTYEFLMGSDDDSWLYIDDYLVIDLGGIHALEEGKGEVYLTEGTHTLDIYFAERHLVQSGFYFEFVDERVEVETVINWDDIHAEIGDEVEFVGDSSYDVDGDISSYQWQFGDGFTGTGQFPSHIYSSNGVYTVTLTVTDDEGATGTDTCLVYITGVENNPRPDPIDEPEDPVDPVVDPVLPDPSPILADDISYSITYMDYIGLTSVDDLGITFDCMAEWGGSFVHYYPGFVLPPEDYGYYAMYDSMSPVNFRIDITNSANSTIHNIMVTALQEFHNNMTIYDDSGDEYVLTAGELKEGDSVESWSLASLDAGDTASFYGTYWIEGYGWGLDQTHLQVEIDHHMIIDDGSAGVYCPPP